MNIYNFLTNNKHLNYCLHIISQSIALLCIIMIRLIRPLLGPPNICPFPLGCTPFAIQQLSTQPFHKAFINIIKRLLLCHPFSHKRF